MPETGSADTGHAIERGQPVVQETVVGIHQIGDGPVLAHHRAQEQLGLGGEGFAQRGIELRIRLGIGCGLVQLAQVQPLHGEIVDQRVRPRIGQQALHFTIQHLGLVQLVLRRQVQQPVIRDRAPQEEGQPRREIEIIDAIDLPRLGGLRIDFQSE